MKLGLVKPEKDVEEATGVVVVSENVKQMFEGKWIALASSELTLQQNSILKGQFEKCDTASQ